MDDIKTQATKVLDKLIDWAETTESFAVEQVPLLVQEIITYYTCYHVAWASLWILVTILGIALMVNGKRASDKIRADNDSRYLSEAESARIWIPVGAGLFFSVLGSLSFFANCIFLLKVRFAPRLFLLEFLKGLV